MKKIYRTYYALTYACTNNCLNCPLLEEQKRSHKFLNPNVILRDMETILKQGYQEVVVELSGGEPLLHPQINEIITMLSDRYNVKIILLTNAQLLENILTTLKRHNMQNSFYTVTAVYHANPDIHDGITRKKGSLKAKLANIEKLLDMGYNVEIKLLIMKPNYKDLPKIAEYIIRKYDALTDKFVFSIHGIDISGNALKYSDKIFVPLSEAIPFVEKTIDNVTSLGVYIYISHIPLCLLDPYYWQFVEFVSPNTVYVSSKHPDGSDIGDNGFNEKNSKKCMQCSLRSICSYWPTYISFYGDSELKPLKILEVLRK